MLTGYRTFIAAGLTSALGVLAAVDWNTVLANPKSAGGLVAIASGVIMAVLRAMTSTPPLSSTPAVTKK